MISLTNEQVASILEGVADSYPSHEVGRASAHRRAAASVRSLKVPLGTFLEEHGSFDRLKGVGPSIAKKLLAIVTKGELLAPAANDQEVAERPEVFSVYICTKCSVYSSAEKVPLASKPRCSRCGGLLRLVAGDRDPVLKFLKVKGFVR